MLLDSQGPQKALWLMEVQTTALAFAELQSSKACRADGDDSLSRPVSSSNEVSPTETPREELESPILLIHSRYFH